MLDKRKMILGIISTTSVIFIALVCFHSVNEIHYLKSFYPQNFTVIDASHAAFVEFIKVALIGFPILFGYRVIKDLFKE